MDRKEVRRREIRGIVSICVCGAEKSDVEGAWVGAKHQTEDARRRLRPQVTYYVLIVEAGLVIGKIGGDYKLGWMRARIFQLKQTREAPVLTNCRT